MQLSWSVDWLSMTLKKSSPSSFFPMFEFGFPIDQWAGARAMHGYTKAATHPYGHLVMSNPDREDMGIHMMISGRALTEIARHKISGLGLCRWIEDNEASVSRIDVAIDIKGERVDVHQLFRSAQTKVRGGRPKKMSLIQDAERGWTLYVGSRQSEKFMRIYDKSAEQGLSEEVLWTRVELELKGDVAKEMARRLAKTDRRSALEFVQGVMKGHFSPDYAPYQRAMSAEAVYVTGSKNVEHDRMTWLMGTVAKSLAKTMKELPHIDVMGLLYERVQAELNGEGSIDTTNSEDGQEWDIPRNE